MNPKFNSILKFLFLLGIGFAFILISTQVHGQETRQVRKFHHSILGTWELDQQEKYGVTVRWIFYADFDWETRRMGYLVSYFNGELVSTIEWRTEGGAIEVRPSSDWKWIHSTSYKTTKWELHIDDQTTAYGELIFVRVCDTNYAKLYCN